VLTLAVELEKLEQLTLESFPLEIDVTQPPRYILKKDQKLCVSPMETILQSKRKHGPAQLRGRRTKLPLAQRMAMNDVLMAKGLTRTGYSTYFYSRGGKRAGQVYE